MKGTLDDFISLTKPRANRLPAQLLSVRHLCRTTLLFIPVVTNFVLMSGYERRPGIGWIGRQCYFEIGRLLESFDSKRSSFPWRFELVLTTTAEAPIIAEARGLALSIFGHCLELLARQYKAESSCSMPPSKSTSIFSQADARDLLVPRVYLVSAIASLGFLGVDDRYPWVPPAGSSCGYRNLCKRSRWAPRYRIFILLPFTFLFFSLVSPGCVVSPPLFKHSFTSLPQRVPAPFSQPV